MISHHILQIKEPTNQRLPYLAKCIIHLNSVLNAFLMRHRMQLVICTKYIFAQNKYKSDTKEHLDLI